MDFVSDPSDAGKDADSSVSGPASGARAAQCESSASPDLRPKQDEGVVELSQPAGLRRCPVPSLPLLEAARPTHVLEVGLQTVDLRTPLELGLQLLVEHHAVTVMPPRLL